MDKRTLFNSVYSDGIKIAENIDDLQNSNNRISDIHLEKLLEFGQVQISDYLIYKIGD